MLIVTISSVSKGARQDLHHELTCDLLRLKNLFVVCKSYWAILKKSTTPI